MLRVFIIVIVGMMLLACHALAQEDYIGTATNALQDVLATLKQNVEKLSIDNDQLQSRDNAMKQQVYQLQTQLGSLEAQEDSLNKSASQLGDKNPHRAGQIAHLEEENSDLDNHIEKTEGDIKLIQQSLDASSPGLQVDARRQKERLKLMKMIYDSQQRQVTLHEAIQLFQKNTRLVPSADVLEQQQLLKEQVKSLEDQAAAYSSGPSSANSGTAVQWDDAQMGQMELELKALEKNYLQLKDLTAQMSQKAKIVPLTVSQRLEEDKLQKSYDDLNREGVGLRRDLDDLRTQMIDLDKRKSRLELMIRQLS